MDSSIVDGPLLHHLLLPAKSFLSLPYSSVLLYRIGEDVRLVGALPVTKPVGGGTDFHQLLWTAEQEQVSFDLAVASPFGRWRPVGRLSLGAQVPIDIAEHIRFNPWNTGGGICPMDHSWACAPVLIAEARRAGARKV